MIFSVGEVNVSLSVKKTLTQQKTIAITGGTGHLGINLISELLDQGFKVRALIRNSKIPMHHRNLKWIQGELESIPSLQNLVDDSFAIIHCASKISVGASDHDAVYKVNVTGTQNLVEACLHSNIRFVYISSSTAVTEPLKGEVFKEDRPLRSDKTFYYAWTKAEAEKYIFQQVKENHLDAFIIRPTAIIGPKDFVPSRFGKTIIDLHQGKLPFITEGGYNMVDVRDLSKTVVNSLTKGKKGNAYLAGGQYMSLKELAKVACSKKTPLVLSINMLLWMLPLIKIYDRLFNLNIPVNRESLITLKNAPEIMDCSKAQNEFAHQNRPVEVSVNDLIDAFNENHPA